MVWQKNMEGGDPAGVRLNVVLNPYVIPFAYENSAWKELKGLLISESTHVGNLSVIRYAANGSLVEFSACLLFFYLLDTEKSPIPESSAGNSIW